MTFKLPKNDRRSTWIRLGLGAIIIRIIFAFFPQLCESLYSRGIYPWIRTFFDETIGRLPFAGIYILTGVFLLWALPKIWKFLFSVLIRRQSLRGKGYGFTFLSFCSAVIFWFLLLWGYNYARIPMAQQIGINVPETMTFQEVWDEAQYITKTCIALRNKIPNIDTNPINASFYPENLEEEMRTLLKQVLNEYGYDNSGNVRGRFLKPNGILLRFSSSGLYFPFTGEGHIDNDLHPITKPFTLAHEMGHGYGFGNEAVCNFLGFLSCIRSKNKAIQYSGYIMYWRYVYGALMEFMTEEEYLVERSKISRGMHNDIEAIYAAQDKHPPFIPFLQPAVYDVFLKVQGIRDGIKSYNKVVILVSSWRNKNN
ncbi:MAG: DUF3810 domain-containing protein [Saprospiraceae bacterium]|nr:DUF3810 domain-containing protein [Saprospiraceae bacterium]